MLLAVCMLSARVLILFWNTKEVVESRSRDTLEAGEGQARKTLLFVVGRIAKYRLCGLMLEPANADGSTFRRIGTFRMDHHKTYRRWPKYQITLV